MSQPAAADDPEPPVGAPIRRRLHGKTPAQAACALQLGDEDTDSSSRAVYLVTLAHPQVGVSIDGIALVAPQTFNREQISAMVLDVCAHPHGNPHWLRRNPGMQPQAVSVLKMVVFRELHAPVDGAAPAAHYHIALHLAVRCRYMSLKRAFLVLHSLASHWSCSHDGFWSAVRYGVFPTLTKPRSALDPKPHLWTSDGAVMDLDDMCEEPTTAAALKARRTQHAKQASEEGKPEPNVQDIDIWPLIVSSGIRNTPDDPYGAEKFIQYSKKHCSPKVMTYLFRNRHRLGVLIDDVWAWEEVDVFLERAGKTRMQEFGDSLSQPCVCDGRWLTYVLRALRANEICIPELCHHVLYALEQGRAENVCVVVLTGKQGGEGKSLFLAPLFSMYGSDHVQISPQAGTFPLLGIETKKICVLNEWYFTEDVLPMRLQLEWFEGKPVQVARPQNVKGVHGHLMYKGTAPIFITTKGSAVSHLLQGIVAAPLGEEGMLLRRLKVFEFRHQMPPPPPPRIIPCARCFADLVTFQATEWRKTH